MATSLMWLLLNRILPGTEKENQIKSVKKKEINNISNALNLWHVHKQAQKFVYKWHKLTYFPEAEPTSETTDR